MASAVHNVDIAAIFETIADLLELTGENPFRARAYRNAALAVRELPHELSAMIDQKQDLRKIPGIGEGIEAKIREIVRRGTCRQLEELRRKAPARLLDLLRLPGLGPKRVAVLHKELGIGDPDTLRKALEDGTVRKVRGFGPKSVKTLLEALRADAGESRRFLRAEVVPYAGDLETLLKTAPGVRDAVAAGSYRRRRETVGDLDLVAAAEPGNRAAERLLAYPGVAKVLARGDTKTTVILDRGLQVDLRVVEPASFGAALHYFTGSKAHNIAVRTMGVKRGLKVNEYGVFKGNRRIAGDTEESVYAAVGLPYIPPELREDRGEFEAAKSGTLPELVGLQDVKGDLHAHTVATDGRNTLEEMAEAARRRGLNYLAITEHTRSLTVAQGLGPKQMREHFARIDALNAKLEGITLLKSGEVDILEDGSLDLPDDVLAEMDLVVASVHSKFKLAREKQTERVLRAMDHRYLTILGHPSGRLIGRRDPYDVDLERIVRHARGRGCFLELDGQPDRLDLNDAYCRMAKEERVKVSVSSDAHSTAELRNLEHGLGQARRGWLGPDDVLNARPLARLLDLAGKARR